MAYYARARIIFLRQEMSKIDSFKYWVDQLQGKSAATREQYTIYFQKFCEFANATPDARARALTKKASLEGVTAHGLRKYFVTSMESARVPEQYYLHMMGKKSSVYSEKRRSELFEAYKKAYPELSIYAQKEKEKEIAELKKQLADMRKTVKLLENPFVMKALEEKAAEIQRKMKRE